MFITDTEKLKKYGTPYREWQGIPSVEITRGGRLFASFYSGGVTEQNGNFSVLIMSDDDGLSWSEPAAAADMGADARAYDSCLWIDPLGRLWYFWAVMPESRIEYVICDDPDAAVLEFSEVCVLWGDVMLNKPIATSHGTWLFPTAVWNPTLTVGDAGGSDGKRPTGAHVLETADEGRTFALKGTVIVENRWFDEHMLLENTDGSMEMFIRTTYGIARAHSEDGGAVWDEADDSRFGGPNSRFHIRRLSSGRVLLVNHYRFRGRNNLTAFILSDDLNGYLGALRIDERNDVSYPDVCEKDGYIYIIYDRERGAHYAKNRDYSSSAREILLAKITEGDIMTGRLTDPGSRLKQTVNSCRKPL